MPRPSRISPEQLLSISRIRGSAAELAQLNKSDARRRASASNIINPHEVKGEYDAGRLLMTTLNGDIRPINHEDLAQFRKNVKSVGGRLKKGLTAQQIVNLSRKEDRERANAQIHMAVPAGTNKGIIRFLTNASKDSNVSRHHVTVDLINYEAAVASPTDPKKLAQWLVKESPLKYDCDCGRHTYWYRYITTIGGFNAGRAENGYPKLKNPNLTGVACKHVLRVMHELSRNMHIRGVIAEMIDRGQKGALRNSGVVTLKKAAEIAKMQKSRKREISVSDAKKKTKLEQRVVAAEPKIKAKSAAAPVDSEQALFDAQRNLRKLMQLGLISKTDFETLIRAKKGNA